MVFDRRAHARRSTATREGRRALARAAEVRAALASQALRPYLDQVDALWPGLTDVDRVAQARRLADAATTVGSVTT